MPECEYISINLSELPFKPGIVDVLNEAGKDGW
jgi:hypothetical protein